MRPNQFRSLRALSIIGVILSLIVLISGKVASNVKPSSPAPVAADFERKLRSHIGQDYTQDMHSSISALFEDSDEVVASSLTTLNSFGHLGIILGAMLMVASGINLMILLRSRSPTESADKGGEGDSAALRA